MSMRGRQVRRQLLAYGVGFGTNFQSTVAAAPIPTELHDLRRRAAEWAEVAHGELTHALIQRYPPGATIGWHRDADVFGSPIIGLSFGGPARMRFRNEATGA
ncbi:MAG TPA: alpha-ketoglutarate-dependent dioxygenase AlkB, partial [Thermoanaerobaculia bacterium]|nr:alpha-ketoglutarate-dependent dioxygenase AlkB [Thermoanaerobaculia bacterium]